MTPRAAIILGLALALVLLASGSLFVVKETERAVMLRFGEMVEPNIRPGLHLKAPLMHTVRKFDARLQTVDARPERFLTQEKKFLSVDSYAKWRVHNVARYYTATNGEELRAGQLLSQRVNNGLRNEFGERTLHEVVSGQRDELMVDIRRKLDEVTREELGIEVVDVRVKRIDLPVDVSESVFARMRAEREREAREYRSEGKEQAEGIRAAADREKTIIEANAYREAEKLRGEGDARAASIYAEAFRSDPEFYAFTRSLKAYLEAFSSSNDLLLFKPDSDFFRYLKDAQGSAIPR